MQNKITRTVLPLIVAGLLGVLGCSNGKSRQAGENLLDATAQAQRHTNAALALMANPYYRDKKTGTNAPLDQLIAKDPNALKRDELAARLEIMPLDEVNPDALKSLDAAQKILTEALRDNNEPGAEKARAVAAAQLAAVMKLKGEYYRSGFFKAAKESAASMRNIQLSLQRALYSRNQAKAYTGMADMGKTKLDELVDATTAQKTEAQEALDGVETDLTKANEAKTALEGENEKVKAARSNLIIESGAATGPVAMEKTQEIGTLGDTIDQNDRKLQEIEQTIDGLNAQKRQITLQINALDERLEMARKVRDTAGDASATVESMKTAADKQAQASMTQVAATMDTLRKQHDLAIGQCTKAEEAYDQALKASADSTRAESTSATLAEQASMNLDLGLIYRERVVYLASVQAGMDRMSALCKEIGADAPEAIKVEGQEKAQTDSIVKFTAAKDTYGRAIAQLPGEQYQMKWAYQGSQAAAYLALAKYGKDDKALTEANRLFEEARKGRENSPHLENVTELGKMAQ